jgi:nicotinamidase-related amidase
MKTALLIIDIQNDYFPGGKMELNKSIEAGINAKELLDHFRDKKMCVVHIKHIAIKPTATFFIRNTAGAEIHNFVKPLETEKLVVKNYPNSFRETDLDSYLKENNINRLVIIGMMTHMCIDSTVRAAFDLGYEIILTGEACATKELMIDSDRVSAENVQKSFLAALKGIFCQIFTKQGIKLNINE